MSFSEITPHKQPRFTSLEKICAFGSILLLICGVAITVSMLNHYKDTFYPGVVIDGVDVSGQTMTQAKDALMARDNAVDPFTLTLHVDDISIASSGAELYAHYEYDKTLEEAFQVGHADSLSSRVWRLVSPSSQKNTFSSQYQLDEEKLKEQLAALAEKVDVKAEQPSAVLAISNSPASLKVSPGTSGRAVDVATTTQKILERLQPGDIHVPAVVATVSAGLSPDQITPAVERAKKYVGKKVIFRADNVFREMDDRLIVNILALPEGISTERLQPTIDELNKEVNRPPQDAEFSYDKETLKVDKFTPARKGLTLNTDEFINQLKTKLVALETKETELVDISLPVKETDPAKTLADTNDLGIKERIGYGESQYEHSIPNRIHNVSLTAERINNFIVRPGEEFSFNKALGDVSSASGFKSAYVIKNGRTELGDGGGVCQVSTTLFRALLNGGLPITKRKAHSYRVSYYELNAKPGIDATVYSGEVDLRFKNDTNNHILIHTQADSKKLYMNVELYGTSDGRQTEIVDHKTWDARPAPAPLYIPDPSLPPGKTKQIDFATSGIKASFKNIVKDKDGNIIREDVYVSNYVPWRAVFLQGQ